MDQISNIQVVPCSSSNYLKPFRVHYSQNGTKKSWDFMRTHDSVSVLIFNTTSHCFILVKQFRPAVYMCELEKHTPQSPEDKVKEGEEKEESEESHGDPPTAAAGVTYELCAGLVDKPDLSLEEIARQEILEECGYDVPVSKLRKITSYRSSGLNETHSYELQIFIGTRSGVGVTGSKQTMFYAEVSDDNCVGEGGGEPQEGELIEVVKVPLPESMNFAFDESLPKTMGVLFSFMWFHSNMAPKYKISTNV
ncbi:NUD14 pyrophosphatase, partial [Polyodon spathula]|nr:NUD14 pyrophosphatase [Polyodon spathula]